jgi:hypothetical protein
MKSNGEPYGLVKIEFREAERGERPRDFPQNNAPPYLKQWGNPVVINKDTSEIIEIEYPYRPYTLTFSYEKCLLGTNKPIGGWPDYIRLYKDISYVGHQWRNKQDQTNFKDVIAKGVFRIKEEDGKMYLVYDGGEFDGQPVILNREGRVLRYPVRRENVALALMNPISVKNGVPSEVNTSPDSRFLNYLNTNPRLLLNLTTALGNPLSSDELLASLFTQQSAETEATAATESGQQVEATTAVDAASANPKIWGKRLKKSKTLKKVKVKTLKKRSRRRH